MTTDIAVMERALVVMAIALAVQTLIFIGAAIGGLIAWRRANQALEEAKVSLNGQIEHLRAHVDRIAGNVDEVAGSVRRGADAVGDVVADVRDVVGSVRTSVGSVASVVTAPRAALAIGLWRGAAMWRRRRASKRLAGAASSRNVNREFQNPKEIGK